MITPGLTQSNFRPIHVNYFPYDSYNININKRKGSNAMPPFPPNNTSRGGPTPMGPPPSAVPQKPAQMRAGTRMVSPGSMRNCIGRFTYVWLSNGQEFWFFPVQIWANTVAGFRWDRRFGWSYTGISLNRIDMFTCT